jgi:hypothetical protein
MVPPPRPLYKPPLGANRLHGAPIVQALHENVEGLTNEKYTTYM